MKAAGDGKGLGVKGLGLTQRGSCPAFHIRQDSDGDEALGVGIPTKASGGAALNIHRDWFKDHIEMVGAPRPERHQPAELFMQAAPSPTGPSRSEAINQVALMADRYRAEIEGQKQAAMVRKVRSSPDLQSMNPQEAVSGAAAPSSGTLAASPGKQVQKAQSERLRSEPSSTPCCLPGRCGGVGGLLEAFLRRAGCCPPVAGGTSSSSSAGLRVASEGAPGRAFDDPGNAVIIFDWDDTLLPTTHILQTVLPNLPPQDQNGAVPKGTPFYEELSTHARIVGFVLRIARRAARVAIVTNSLSPWVIASGRRYLPGLDIQALLEELDIPVYYARRHVPELTKQCTYSEQRFRIEIDHSAKERIGLDIVPAERMLRIARVDETGLVAKWNAANPREQVQAGDWITSVNGQTEKLAEECRKPQVIKIDLMRQVPDRDPYMEAKLMDMSTVLRKFYSGAGQARQNVISIGDSEAEQVAVKEALPRTGRPKQDSLCKTVNLLLRPTINQLSNELKILLVWLSHMVAYDQDFDLAMDNLGGFERKLFQTPESPVRR